MEKKTLEILFTNKHFCIPDYQRDYAWQSKNVADLFEDVRESIETGTRHYVGTFILSKVNPVAGEATIIAATQLGDGIASPPTDSVRRTASATVYNLVDGQQRLTTISMILHALIAELPSNDVDRIVYESRFLRSRGVPLLILQDINHGFFCRLVANSAEVEPGTRGQRLMAAAYADIKRYVQALRTNGNGADAIRHWLEAIKDLEVLEFIEDDEGRAIRIFQTVNDRGVPLTNMDKAKSLLVYYSNRFLDGKLDHSINDCFGTAYRCFDSIKEIAEAPQTPIDLMKAQRFTEDSILRWHFVSPKTDKWIYNATEEYVLDGFLRPSLKERRENKENLEQFIKSYTNGVRDFFAALLSLIGRVSNDARYYKLFVLLGPSTYLYPLIVRLSQQELIDQQVPGDPRFTFRQLMEIIDIRVYKTRRTDPAVDVTTLARDLGGMSPNEIAAALRTFVLRFMPDTEFEPRLRQDVDGNEALVSVFFALDEELLAHRNALSYSVQRLSELRAQEPTIEHVFAQKPLFDFPGHGFGSGEQYAAHCHRFGNLLVLEKSLNSRCNNRTVHDKITVSNLYGASSFECVQQFRQDRSVKGPFDVEAVNDRTEVLIRFCLDHWPIWNEQSSAAVGI